MASEEEPSEQVVAVRLLRLNAAVQGISTGLVAGLAVFVATNWLVIKGGHRVGRNLRLLGHYFIGYEVTFLGSLIGFAYAFALGFVVGYTVARLYNWLAGLKEPRAS